MEKTNNKILGATLAGVMTVSSVAGVINTVEIQNVEAASNQDINAVHAKIEHIKYSLKNNYLGLKNVGQWQAYIKEARSLNAKLPNGSSKDKYAKRINESENLINAAARVNHVEKSMDINAKVMRNVPQWEEYVRLAKVDLAKVDLGVFKPQYDKLLERIGTVNLAISSIKDNDNTLKLVKKDGSKVSKLNHTGDLEVSGNSVTLTDSKINGDLKITGNNINITNVNITGKLIVDPGKDGVVNVNEVNAKEIVVLSGAEKSVIIDASIADKLTVDSKTNVKVKLTGKTEVKTTEIASNSIFENVSASIGKLIIGGDKPLEIRYKNTKETPIVITNSVKLLEGSDIVKDAKVDSNVKGIKIEGNFKNLVIERLTDKIINLLGNIDKINVNVDAEVKFEKGIIETIMAKEGTKVKVEADLGAIINNIIGVSKPEKPIPPEIEEKPDEGDQSIEEKLSALKIEAKKVLEAYKEYDYLESDWNVMVIRINSGIKAISSARDIRSIEEAKKNVLSGMGKFKTINEKLSGAKTNEEVNIIKNLAEQEAAKRKALAKIDAYSNNIKDGDKIPTIADYRDASIKNINEDNIKVVNEAIGSKSKGETNTVDKINEILAPVVALAKIDAWATNFKPLMGNPPIAIDFITAGVVGVNADTYPIILNALRNKGAGTADTVKKIQAIFEETIRDENNSGLEIINNYAKKLIPEPIVTDYTGAGIKGVNGGNIHNVNIALNPRHSSEIDTTYKLQLFVNDIVGSNIVEEVEQTHEVQECLNKIGKYLDSIPRDRVYKSAGLKGVSIYNLSAINAAVLEKGSIANLDELQALADPAIKKVANEIFEEINRYGKGESNQTIYAEQYSLIGIKNVWYYNYSEVNEAVRANKGVSSLEELQRIADKGTEKARILAVNKISAYADSSKNPIPTAIDYFRAGIKNVSETANLITVNEAIADRGKEEADTTEKIKAIADISAAALEKIDGYAESEYNAMPGVADYIAAGVRSINESNVDKMNELIKAKKRWEANTLEKIQAILISGYANSKINVKPTVYDYVAAGIEGVTEGNLDEVNKISIAARSTDEKHIIQYMVSLNKVMSIIDGLQVTNETTAEGFINEVKKVPINTILGSKYKLNWRNGAGFNLKEATSTDEGMVSGTLEFRIPILNGQEKVLYRINVSKPIAKLSGQSLSEVKTSAAKVIESLKVTNETNQEYVLKSVNDVIKNPKITAKWKESNGFKKEKATIDKAGNISGTIELAEEGKEPQELEVSKEIDKLQGQSLLDAEAASTKAIEDLEVTNETTEENVLDAVKNAVTNKDIIVQWKAENGFSIEKATKESDGNISGIIELVNSNDKKEINIAKTIVKLPSETPRELSAEVNAITTGSLNQIVVTFSEGLNEVTKGKNNINDVLESIKVINGDMKAEVNIESAQDTVKWSEVEGKAIATITIPETTIVEGDVITLTFKEGAITSEKGNTVLEAVSLNAN